MKKFIIALFILITVQLSAFAKQTINIAFTIDNNYPIFTMLAINSIFLNNYNCSDYHFYIVENNLSDKNKEKMRKFITNANENNTFKSELEFINIDTDTIDKGKYLFAFSNRITPIAIARIMLPDLLDIDKVLYMDGDILVTTDLLPLYETDLKNYVAGMVPNITQSTTPDIHTKTSTYFNSGVILMDLKKCRKMKSTEQMISYLNQNLDRFIYDKTTTDNQTNIDKFLYPDQDLINIVWDGKIKALDKKWNNQTIYGVQMLFTTSDCIIHYIGPVKPWSFKKPMSKAEKQYLTYWDECQELRIYKYYYGWKKIQKDIKYMSKLKLHRYKNLIKSIISRRNSSSVFELFFMPDHPTDNL